MINYETYNHAGEVPLGVWHKRGIRTIILDKDGTLTGHNSDVFVRKVIDGLIANDIQTLYPEGCWLISNNDDADHVDEVAYNLSDELDIRVRSMCQASGYRRKPHPQMGLNVAMNERILPERIGVIGDRLLVDVAFARRLGAGAIALCDKVGEGDAWSVATLRKLERLMVNADQDAREIQYALKVLTGEIEG